MKRLMFFLILLSVISISYAVNRDEALNAIENAKFDIIEMQQQNISIVSVNDSLNEAQKAYERAEFAELLVNNASGELAEEAKHALEGLSYKGFSYNDVIEYTDEILIKKQQAFSIMDSFIALDIKIKDYRDKSVDVTEAEVFLSEAKSFFEKERFTEVEEMILQIHVLLEDEYAKNSKVNLLILSSKSFIEKNWIELSILSLILLFNLIIFWRWNNHRLIKAKIKNMKFEHKALLDLIKQTQEERFKKGTISGLVYNVRIARFNKRIDRIKDHLPILEEQLKRGF